MSSLLAEFLGTTILLLLAKLFDRKSFGVKSGIKKSVTELKDEIKKNLKKFKK